jgi:hypothetical protein
LRLRYVTSDGLSFRTGQEGRCDLLYLRLLQPRIYRFFYGVQDFMQEGVLLGFERLTIAD